MSKISLLMTAIFIASARPLAVRQSAQTPANKPPNIVDDHGHLSRMWNLYYLSSRNDGGRTRQNMTASARRARFTDYYGQQSVQRRGAPHSSLAKPPFRTGLVMVGHAGCQQGIQDS